MSKRLNLSGVVYRRLKANREENQNKYVGCRCICKEVSKTRKSNDDKGGNKQTHQDP